jgi:hypothetical protein
MQTLEEFSGIYVRKPFCEEMDIHKWSVYGEQHTAQSLPLA